MWYRLWQNIGARMLTLQLAAAYKNDSVRERNRQRFYKNYEARAGRRKLKKEGEKGKKKAAEKV